MPNAAQSTSEARLVVVGVSGAGPLSAAETRPTERLAVLDGASARAVGPSPAASAPTATASRSGRKAIFAGVGLLALAAAGWYGNDYWVAGRFMVSTDDAYVSANTTTLAAKVSGYVSQILVEDNSPVHAGDLVARIDDGDYRLAVDSARAKAATQQATLQRFDRQIAAQQASVEQARAQIASAVTAQTRARQEFDRQQTLANKDFASRQALEQAVANRDQSDASLKGAQAALAGALANVDVLKAQQTEAARGLDELNTALAKAKRDLSFTEIRAPDDGVIGNRALQPGDFVQTGQRVAALVPLSGVYIDANFKETQLERLRPGQPVAVAVDALPDEKITGVVASVSPASGSVFSLLPPDNATGNFTKIVQRLAVRIHVPASVAERGELRPGMSVVVSINTKPHAVAPLARVSLN